MKKNITENYLNYIQQESVLTILNSLFVLFGAGSPADRRFQVHALAHNLAIKNCERMHGGSITTSKKVEADVEGKQKERHINDTRETTIKTYKEDPEYGMCIVKCQYTYLKNIVTLLQKEGKGICKKNMNKDLCERWVDRYLPELEAKKEALEAIIKTGSKGANVNLVVNSLKKIL